MQINKINPSCEIPSGLIRKPFSDAKMTIENVELRAALDKAVEDAKLNVTERMALNHKFFPNGGGFKLFPENVRVPEINIFYAPGKPNNDSFTREINNLKIPEYVSQQKQRVIKSSKGNFQANFDNAVKKLKKVLNRADF